MHPDHSLSTLFRTEYRKMVSVLARHFGLENISIAQDIVADTFLLASETWENKGLPDNPTAWLYTVAKNKTKDYLKRDMLFKNKITNHLKISEIEFIEIDTSVENIENSELQMLFALCHPSIPVESQIGLSLRILFGLGIEEIAEAFLSNKETINKRLFRAKEKLREENIQIEMPAQAEIAARLHAVVAALYLLFNEGYYSASQNAVLRKDICLQALYLASLLSRNAQTNTPDVNALIALMCFHASRFEARTQNEGNILFDDQDRSLWDQELIQMGQHFLDKAATGNKLTKYHLEAAIAYWHTQPADSPEKWRNILFYYNLLLQVAYSPIAALNRTYALARAESVEKAIEEALKLNLESNYLYFTLLGELYAQISEDRALRYFEQALELTKNEQNRKIISAKMSRLRDLSI